MNLFSFLKRNNLDADSGSKKSLSGMYSETEFKSVILRECVRCDRGGGAFSLVIFDLSGKREKDIEQLRKILIVRGTRIIDEVGQFDKQHIGICLQNTDKAGAVCFAKNIDVRIIAITGQQISYKIYVYPTDWKDLNNRNGHLKNFYKNNGISKESRVYSNKSSSPRDQVEIDFTDYVKPDNESKKVYNSIMPTWKRLVDIVVSALALVVLSPLFLIIAVLIKVVAPGPVFFKQERVGLMGKAFIMIKFRSMKIGNCTNAHKEYFAELVNSTKHDKGNLIKPMIKRDSINSLIPYGKVLRSSCIDELPQLINVLCGEMSLIGPRPPIPYEVDEYFNWHNGRFNAVPGITGLWQVSGKNRLTFDQMIRLDIRYSRQGSFWLDLKIILKTPFAVMSQAIDSVKYSDGKIKGDSEYA